MASSPAPLREVPSSEIAFDHRHAAGEVCPFCEQPIANAKLEETKKRIEAKEQERTAEITSRLQGNFERAQAAADAKAKAALDQARLDAAEALQKEKSDAAAQVETARVEAKRQAEVVASEKVAAAEQATDSIRTTLQAQLTLAAQAKAAAEQNRDALQVQLEQARTDGAAAVEQVKQQAAGREAEVRTEASRVAAAAAQEKIESIERSRQEAEAALRERLEATEAGKSAVEKAAAEAKVLHEDQVRAFNETLGMRLQEQREALEKDKSDAIRAEKAAAFADNQKLATKVDELQRAIDKQTSEELGEGAEINLYEVLKADFGGDRITRVEKGTSGADIIHVVIHNGRECGTIIYDSKNHNAWRNDFVTKLAADQIAAKAEHAILSIHKFPAGARQLSTQEGIILANPARVVAIVQILRRHLVQLSTLRLSKEKRSQKMATLYNFITSERCTDLFTRIDTQAEGLLELQVKEKKAHEATWKKQGEVLRSVQKVNAEIVNEIDMIIGTAEDPRSEQ